MKKILIVISVMLLLFSMTGCSKKKEIKTEFKDFNEFLSNFDDWDFDEKNFKKSDFERSEDDDYNPSFIGIIKIGKIKGIGCSYQFKKDKLIRVSLHYGDSHNEEAISEAKYMVNQLKKNCDIYIQEATNKALKDYTNSPIYNLRINNDVDPMNNITDMISKSVDGGEHSIIFRSKNGEFKDIKFVCMTQSGSEGAGFSTVISNVKNDNQTAYYSTEAEESE